MQFLEIWDFKLFIFKFITGKESFWELPEKLSLFISLFSLFGPQPSIVTLIYFFIKLWIFMNIFFFVDRISLSSSFFFNKLALSRCLRQQHKINFFITRGRKFRLFYRNYFLVEDTAEYDFFFIIFIFIVSFGSRRICLSIFKLKGFIDFKAKTNKSVMVIMMTTWQGWMDYGKFLWRFELKLKRFAQMSILQKSEISISDLWIFMIFIN